MDPQPSRYPAADRGAWIGRAVARAEMWMTFAAFAAAVFVALGAAAGVAYASSWLTSGGGQ